MGNAYYEKKSITDVILFSSRIVLFFHELSGVASYSVDGYELNKSRDNIPFVVIVPPSLGKRQTQSLQEGPAQPYGKNNSRECLWLCQNEKSKFH